MSDPRTCASRDLDSLTPQQQERLAEALSEYLGAMERGESPELDRLLDENADIADLIQSNVDGLRLLHAAVEEFPSESVTEAPEELGKKELGDFRILREVGRGGMGVVYEAHQMSLDRKVALKILPFAAVLDQKQIARFKNEARAAAQLHHTNIVPVYSVGCERGVHYYAMQFIEGCPLDRALSRIRADVPTESLQDIADGKTPSKTDGLPANRSTVAAAAAHVETADGFSLAGSLEEPDHWRAVAEIGVQVARALQHAHDFGIVHRDVKPSNLLLDDRGKVWVTDFGLALFQADSRVTLTGDIVGTLRYMSPEQASGKAGIVDQRTDVYSLGITLYELLTLREAFEGTDRRSILYQVENEDPIPPRKIDANIPRDLETIVLKATAKIRDERYSTAGELADDLERFLRGEPTVARRATLVERCAKWARRHETTVRWAQALVLVALIGLAATTMMFATMHARASNDNQKVIALLDATEKSRLRAEANEAMAVENLRQARSVLDRFAMQYTEELRHIAGAEPLRGKVLEGSLDYYNDFVARAGDTPSLRRDLRDMAVAYSKIGVISEEIGKRAEALNAFGHAIDQFEKLVARQPDDAGAKADLALCYNNIGLILERDGQVDKARDAYQNAIAAQRALVQAEPNDDRIRGHLALSCQNLSLLEDKTGNTDRAIASCEEAIQIEEVLVRHHPDEPRYFRHLAKSYADLGRFQIEGEPAAAERHLLKALQMQNKLVKRHPDNLDYRNDLVLNYNYLGTLQRNRGNLDRAGEYYSLARQLESQLTEKAPAVVKYRLDSAVSENNLGQVCFEKGEYGKAESLFTDARKQLAGLVAEYPENVKYRSSLGGTLNNLGMVLERQGRKEEAAGVYAEAIREQRRAYQAAPTVDQFRGFLQRQYANYIRVLKGLGREDDAAEAETALKAITDETRKPEATVSNL